MTSAEALADVLVVAGSDAIELVLVLADVPIVLVDVVEEGVAFTRSMLVSVLAEIPAPVLSRASGFVARDESKLLWLRVSFAVAEAGLVASADALAEEFVVAESEAIDDVSAPGLVDVALVSIGFFVMYVFWSSFDVVVELDVVLDCANASEPLARTRPRIREGFLIFMIDIVRERSPRR